MSICTERLFVCSFVRRHTVVQHVHYFFAEIVLSVAATFYVVYDSEVDFSLNFRHFSLFA